tara:strand:+ start:94 stop:1071 length:978 start_codon:yes stop_codon:yes gene_type:complete
MRYQFNFEKALKKRIETIKKLRGFLEIEEEMREFLHDEMLKLHKQGDEKLSASYQIQWMRWSKYCSAWAVRICAMETSQLSLELLDEQDEIYIEEGFYITLGINPSTLISPSGFMTWRLQDIPTLKRIEKEDRLPLKEGEMYPTFWNIEERLRRFPEYIKLERKFPSDKIITQEFIEKWAFPKGYIEPRQAEFYRDTKYPPYDESFSKLLHEELRKDRFIEGEHNEEWRWIKSDNSLSWLCKDLHRHQIPKSYYEDEIKDPVWDDFEHYFYYPKDKYPLRKQRPLTIVEDGESVPMDVPHQRKLEKIVEKLLLHEGITSGRKEFD